MERETLYSDSLVEIDRETICFRKYYFPTGQKKLQIKDIRNIIYYEPNWWSGKYRYWGSGDFRTWCPYDRKRRTRDYMFVLYKKRGWVRIGFTVEDSASFLKVFKGLGVDIRNFSIENISDLKSIKEQNRLIERGCKQKR